MEKQVRHLFSRSGSGGRPELRPKEFLSLTGPKFTSLILVKSMDSWYIS